MRKIFVLTLALAALPVSSLYAQGTMQPVTGQPVTGQPATAGHAQTHEAAFNLPALPYDEAALEPAIDAETMRIHHERHHQAYVNNLNNAVSANAELAGMTLEQMMANMSSLPNSVRDNGGGHWNHTFFWESMAPAAQSGEPSGELLAAIEESFGSLDNFKTEFAKAGTSRFGSGWVWLIVDGAGDLAITSTPNQDNPLMDLAETRGTPVLGNDVWEHAYYLKYQNRRGDYLSNWWQVVNWPEVSRRYAEAHSAQ